MVYKQYNTSLEFILSIISTIVCILFTILIFFITVQLQFSFNQEGTRIMFIGSIIKETTRAILLTVGIVCSIALTFVDLLLLKASFSIKHKKWGWGFFLLFVGIIAIISIKTPLLIWGILLSIAGIVSIFKHFLNKNV